MIQSLLDVVGALGLAQCHRLHVLDALGEVGLELLGLLSLELARDTEHVLEHEAVLELGQPLLGLLAQELGSLGADPRVNVEVAAALGERRVQHDVALGHVERTVRLVDDATQLVLELRQLRDLLVAHGPDLESGLLAELAEQPDAIDHRLLRREAQLLDLGRYLLLAFLLFGNQLFEFLLTSALFLSKSNQSINQINQIKSIKSINQMMVPSE